MRTTGEVPDAFDSLDVSYNLRHDVNIQSLLKLAKGPFYWYWVGFLFS